MTLNTPSVPSKKQNHRKPLIVRDVQWFWRFSQFYGEYTVRSPKERQQWLDQQRINQQRG
ncbi:MAG: hypothetical protein AAF716_11360 [Cyanobacteria bacterium P01_D01_bin.1]